MRPGGSEPPGQIDNMAMASICWLSVSKGLWWHQREWTATVGVPRQALHLS